MLFADIGNSSFKIYKSDGSLKIFKYNNKKEIINYIESEDPEVILISSVSEDGFHILKAGLKNRKLVNINYKADFSFGTDIENPETLGPDRLLQIEGSLSSGILPDLIVIGAGSAVTIDLVINESNSVVFKGGLIIPGEYLQYKSLISNTDIDEQSSNYVQFSLIGRNTESAVKCGIRNCLCYGVKGIINALASEYSVKNIAVTGRGNKFITDYTDFFDSLNGIRIVFNENLIYSGFVSIAKKMKLM
jgi:type III pantothenate kinase